LFFYGLDCVWALEQKKKEEKVVVESGGGFSNTYAYLLLNRLQRQITKDKGQLTKDECN